MYICVLDFNTVGIVVRELWVVGDEHVALGKHCSCKLLVELHIAAVGRRDGEIHISQNAVSQLLSFVIVFLDAGLFCI